MTEIRKTLFTSVADAPRVTLAVEGEDSLKDRVRVQGSSFLPPGMGVVVDPAFLLPPLPERPDPLMSGEAMDLDANDAYWRPE